MLTIYAAILLVAPLLMAASYRFMSGDLYGAGVGFLLGSALSVAALVVLQGETARL